MSDADRNLEREITPQPLYLGRRAFMRAGVLVASTVATGYIYKKLNHVAGPGKETAKLAGIITGPTTGQAANPLFRTDEPQNSFQQITHYNNFYEFSTDKDGVADASANFKTDGWTVEVGGLVNKPKTFGIDELLKLAPLEERIYRMRCVEAWSMVIPWVGFPLSTLLDRVEPQSSAKYVAFETLHDANRMPGQKEDVLEWPYIEGLRMDEAMNPLAILATGIYGRELPAQDGAPIRLVTPWKYGFKGIKSIVKITLVEKQPPTTWNKYGPREYGFYANVNPTVDHPRWSQATEQRIGESGRRKTLMFNGYGEQVAQLYTGMDLRANY